MFSMNVISKKIDTNLFYFEIDSNFLRTSINKLFDYEERFKKSTELIRKYFAIDNAISSFILEEKPMNKNFKITKDVKDLFKQEFKELKIDNLRQLFKTNIFINFEDLFVKYFTAGEIERKLKVKTNDLLLLHILYQHKEKEILNKEINLTDMEQYFEIKNLSIEIKRKENTLEIKIDFFLNIYEKAFLSNNDLMDFIKSFSKQLEILIKTFIKKELNYLHDTLNVISNFIIENERVNLFKIDFGDKEIVIKVEKNNKSLFIISEIFDSKENKICEEKMQKKFIEIINYKKNTFYELSIITKYYLSSLFFF